MDGKNWTVLFDSAVSGTYVEPKDGSGRSYRVGKEKEEADIEKELERELDRLFAEFDFGGIQINSEATQEGKKQAIKDGKLHTELVGKLEKVLLNLFSSINNKASDINKRKEIYRSIKTKLRKHGKTL